MDSESAFDVGLGLEDSHVVVTGGAGAIGSVIVYVPKDARPASHSGDDFPG